MFATVLDTLAGVVGVIVLGLLCWTTYRLRANPDELAALAAASLGVLFGWIVRFFFARMHTFNPNGLSVIIAAIVGVTVLGFFKKLNPGQAFAFYPIGLFVGYFSGALWMLIRW